MKDQTTEDPDLKVLVGGAVANTGFYCLADGSTLGDAIDAAGGLSAKRGWYADGSPCVFPVSGKLTLSRPWGWNDPPNQKVLLFDLNEESWRGFELQHKDGLIVQARVPDEKAIVPAVVGPAG